MLDTNEAIYRQYETLGISKEVLDFGTSVEKELKERFDKIDTNAEYNQLKVIAAMQKNKISMQMDLWTARFVRQQPIRRCKAW